MTMPSWQMEGDFPSVEHQAAKAEWEADTRRKYSS